MDCVTRGYEQSLKSQVALMLEVENQWNTSYEKRTGDVAAVVQTLVCTWWLKGPREPSCCLWAAVTLQAHSGDLVQSLHCRSSLSQEVLQVLSPCFVTGLLGLSERRSTVCSVMAAAGMAWASSPPGVLLPPHLHVL